MAKPTFQSGATTITFYRGEQYPNVEEPIPFQSVGYLPSGKIKVATYDPTPGRIFHFEYVLRRPGVSGTSSLADLKAVIDVTVKFTATAFTYTDSRGTPHTVRILHPVSYPEESFDNIRGRLTLIEEKS